MDLRILFLMFWIYSFFGWIVDIIGYYMHTKKIVSRGFLIGPYCPIYGVGAIAITFLLGEYKNDTIVLFILCCVLGAVIEYFTSYIMEKIFKTRWWDYSDNRYNINGRICLFTTACFGALGVLVLKVLDPIFLDFLLSFPDLALTIISVMLLALFVADTVISFNIIYNIKRVDLSNVADTTEEVTRKVKEVLKNSSIWSKRLVMAFPNLKVRFPSVDIAKIKNNLKKIKKDE